MNPAAVMEEMRTERIKNIAAEDLQRRRDEKAREIAPELRALLLRVHEFDNALDVLPAYLADDIAAAITATS